MGILASKLTKSNLTKEDVNAISQEVVKRITSNSNPVLIYLFGSAANMSMTMASDFDFAIIFFDDIDLKKEKKHIFNMKLFPDIHLDLLFFKISDFQRKADIGGVCWEIKNRGKIVYDQRAKI